jgi:hypothetical protein
VDASDGGEADQGQIRHPAGDKLGWPSAGTARHHTARPLYQALERDPSLVKKWLRTEFPKIKKAAETLGADIYFGDAAHIRSDHHAGRTWGKKGETPTVVTTGARHGMSLLSAITSKGHMRFMIKEKGGVNSDVFIEFLKRLLVGAKRPVFLIVDRGPAHISKKTKAFVATLGSRLKLLYLRRIAILMNWCGNISRPTPWVAW